MTSSVPLIFTSSISPACHVKNSRRHFPLPTTTATAIELSAAYRAL
ncbi:hypothetical protein HMPREF9565_02628 [Cutibacterium acnes HL053PA2]|nr:hypothetical protein HMPREF9566_01119 [Cutibacterium acnes HL045PA1]EFT49183.1 hypothetical protein HMPREF9565_02628 [Cutibacterium acnes HL053PA2]EFT56869.1 hypothetical protein HMPREF9610_00139 [Cutibacterium acnes HL027PA2]EFT68795.1 hypothetical protein HMPREF9583_00895 [Cutibacterium acnes HL038PA1]EFT72556.1 hypothetical protein HMPREF9592_00413 [Cutibacterium acnes HL046PA1]EGE93603.1 hypothetical protein HMPREF9571_01059 [Cutibacterium acnes HL043PA2]EGF65533.1 hypothetical protein